MSKLPAHMLATLSNEMKKLEAREAALRSELSDVHTSLKYLRKVVRGANSETTSTKGGAAAPGTTSSEGLS